MLTGDTKCLKKNAGSKSNGGSLLSWRSFWSQAPSCSWVPSSHWSTSQSRPLGMENTNLIFSNSRDSFCSRSRNSTSILLIRNSTNSSFRVQVIRRWLILASGDTPDTRIILVRFFSGGVIMSTPTIFLGSIRLVLGLFLWCFSLEVLLWWTSIFLRVKGGPPTSHTILMSFLE